MAETAAVDRRWRSRQSLETGQRSAAGWVGLCDAEMAAGSERGNGPVGGGVAVVAADVAVAAGGAAASVGVAAGAGAGSSVMR